MDPIIFFGVLITIHGVLFFFDRFFKSCMHYPYDSFLKNTGITVSFLRLRLHFSTALNRQIRQLFGNGGGLCCRSYTAGVFLSIMLVPVGLIILIITIFGNSNGSQQLTENSGITTTVKLEVLLPGINLPLDEIGYYVASLLCSTVIHEMGHALAALQEDVPVTGFGFYLYFCLPLAYTEISSEHLNNLKWFKKLRILCAGIWHNCIFASLCYLLLSTVQFAVTPFYTMNEGIIVTNVASNSPLRSKSGPEMSLMEGNIIRHINDCEIYNEESWFLCLLASLKTKPAVCVSSDFIRLNDESIEIAHHSFDGQTLQCCDEKNIKLNCFEYIDDFSNDAPVEIPQHVCLDIRRTMEDSYGYCTTAGSCERGFCLRPLLRNSTTILRFKRQLQQKNNLSQKHTLKDVIYMGHPLDVTRSVRISPFVPKLSYVKSGWGDSYLLFLKYNIVFSFGLAIVNAIPCFGFDGHHITNTIVNSFLVGRIERPKRDVIASLVSGVGSLLFIFAFLKVLWLSLFRYLF